MVVKTSLIKGQVGNTTIHGESIPGKIMLLETLTDVQIYVHPGSMKHGRLPAPDTSEELCKCCGIGDERMKSLVVNILLEDDHQELEDVLSKHRIGGFDENDLEAVPIKVPAQTRVSSSNHHHKPRADAEAPPEAPNSTEVPSKQAATSEIALPVKPSVLNEMVNQSRPSKIPYQGYSSTPSAPEMNARERQQAARYTNIGEVTRIGGRENVPQQTHSTSAQGYSARNIRPSKPLKPAVRSGRELSPQKSSYERPVVMMSGRDQSREESVGIHGEEAVFHTLKDIFGSEVDESMWTSELRHHVQGFMPWTPEDPTELYSDFTVRDRNGVLANWMLANKIQIPPGWEPADFRYHIEVKSTTKSVEDPFYMSHLQMDKARRISEMEKSLAGPREVFVIFRVHGLDLHGEAEAGLEIYCDPWRMVERGELGVETWEWRVTPT